MIQHNQTLLGPILSAGRLIGHSCKGIGTCGACIIWVQGRLNEPTERELNTLENRGALPDERLACTATALGHVMVWSPGWGPKCED